MNTIANIRTATATAALVASAALATVVHAAPAGDAPGVVIRYDAASVATGQGARELYQRIERAAAQVCPEGSAYGLAHQSVVQQCRRDAIARAVDAIHQQRLVEIAAAHTRRG